MDASINAASRPVALSWSGGKDSALALLELDRDPERDVAVLLTTVTEEYDRISMHGVRRELLEAQADALGLPLRTVRIPAGAGNDLYEARTLEALHALADEGVEAIAYGDVYLDDVRRYRETLTARAGLTSLFPLWGRDTGALARDVLDAGFRAVLVCVDTRAADASLAGRAFDHRLLAELPAGTDPCGEKGEFHTFVFDGSMFQRPVRWQAGESVLRDDRFAFHELLPA